LSFVQISELVSSGTSLREARETALRTADVIACEHTELLELSFDDAWTVVQRVPNFSYILKVCVFITAGPMIKLCAGGEGEQ
jgi:hypothetical protein